MPDPSSPRRTTSWSYVMATSHAATPAMLLPIAAATWPRQRPRRPPDGDGLPHVLTSSVWTRPASVHELLQLWNDANGTPVPYARVYRPPSAWHQPIADDQVGIDPESLWLNTATPGWEPLPAPTVIAMHNLRFTPLPLAPEVVADAISHLGRAGNLNRRFGPGSPAPDEAGPWKPWLAERSSP